MRYPLILKGTLSLLFASFTLAANAQRIDEQQLKIKIGKIENSTQHLKNLEPVTFKYDVDKYSYLQLPEGPQYGFLASNVKPEFPEMVYEASKVYGQGKNSSKVAKYSEVNSENMIPLLVAAIKEQQAEIELLKKELNLLKEKSR